MLKGREGKYCFLYSLFSKSWLNSTFQMVSNEADPLLRSVFHIETLRGETPGKPVETRLAVLKLFHGLPYKALIEKILLPEAPKSATILD
jgi:hypothetical protein